MNVARVGDASVIAAVDVNNTLWFYWQTIGTAEWNFEQVAPGGVRG
jgi:hypothetical protein